MPLHEIRGFVGFPILFLEIEFGAFLETHFESPIQKKSDTERKREIEKNECGPHHNDIFFW